MTQTQGQMPASRVVSEKVGCCSGTIPPARVENTVNRMLTSGYVLSKAYVDVEATCGPCCRKKTVILI